MIIGRGDLSKVIPDRKEFIFYANGCSNREPLTKDARIQEHGEILKYRGTDKMFVYFSTLSIYYPDISDYTLHKIKMENMIRNRFENYCIMRIGNITWGDNPNTLVNYLTKNQSRIEDTFRYLTTEAEFRHWCNMIPFRGRHEMNITGRIVSIKDLIQEINERKIHSD